MKTSEQILIEWVTDSIKFEAYGVKIWSRKRIEILADVAARRKTKMEASAAILGSVVDAELVMTLTAMYEAGPSNVTGRWLAGFETLAAAEREIRRIRITK